MMRMAIWMLALSGHALAGDFLADPKALCGEFEAQGMKAQMRWGAAPQGSAYFCQYADEFSASSTHVRAVQAYIDPEGKMVGLGLSVQVLGGMGVRAEAADALQTFVDTFYKAHGRTAPEDLAKVMSVRAEGSLDDGDIHITTTDEAMWARQSVIGVTLKRVATPQQLAALTSSVSPAEQAHAATVRGALEQRCDAAITASGHAQSAAVLKKKTTPLSASRILVEAGNADGTFQCQVCDEDDAAVNCGTMGLMLSYRSAAGDSVHLPAELERKCVYHVQKEAMADDAGVFIDHEIVRRIHTRAIPSEKRHVFEHELDGRTFRCVVRKSDLSFALEYDDGSGQWHGLVAGILL